MKLLLLTTSFPRAEGDAAGRFVFEQAAELARRGCTVRVLAPDEGPAPRGVERLAWAADPVLLGGIGAPDVLEARPLRGALGGLRSVAALTVAARRHARPDERVVGHWLIPGGLAALATGRPAHLFAHGGDVGLLERLRARPLARRLDGGARGITFVSPALRTRFERLLGRAPRAELSVCPMGVSAPAPDPEFAAALRRRAAGRPIVATVGRRVPIKGLDVLDHALRDLQVVWFAAGEGPVQPGRATLLGHLDPPRRDALLSVADAFVHPSRPIRGRTEGAPVVLLEALRAGAPVVASATGGIPGLVGHAATLVPPEDARALRAAIERALDQPRDAHVAWAARFDWRRVGAEHLRLIERSGGAA